jgi:hypothetical protein
VPQSHSQYAARRQAGLTRAGDCRPHSLGSSRITLFLEYLVSRNRTMQADSVPARSRSIEHQLAEQFASIGLHSPSHLDYQIYRLLESGRSAIIPCAISLD